MDTVSPFLLNRLIDASVDGIFAFDRYLRFIVWNGAMQRIAGLSSAEVFGRSVIEVFPFLREDSCIPDALTAMEQDLDADLERLLVE